MRSNRLLDRPVIATYAPLACNALVFGLNCISAWQFETKPPARGLTTRLHAKHHDVACVGA
jgi:hypothetical protein